MSNMHKKLGHVLVVPKPEALRTGRQFLLMGDSFAEKRYQIALQVFTCLKREGAAFQLSISVPRLLQQKIQNTVRECGLEDVAKVLVKPPESKNRYKEVVEVTDMLGQSFVLRKSNKVVTTTANSLMTNLKGMFEVRN